MNSYFSKYPNLSANNERYVSQLERLIQEALGRALQAGFHGEVMFTVQIHDGAIQLIEVTETHKHK